MLYKQLMSVAECGGGNDRKNVSKSTSALSMAAASSIHVYGCIAHSTPPLLRTHQR